MVKVRKESGMAREPDGGVLTSIQTHSSSLVGNGMIMNQALNDLISFHHRYITQSGCRLWVLT